MVKAIPSIEKVKPQQAITAINYLANHPNKTKKQKQSRLQKISDHISGKPSVAVIENLVKAVEQDQKSFDRESFYTNRDAFLKNISEGIKKVDFDRDLGKRIIKVAGREISEEAGRNFELITQVIKKHPSLSEEAQEVYADIVKTGLRQSDRKKALQNLDKIWEKEEEIFFDKNNVLQAVTIGRRKEMLR